MEYWSSLFITILGAAGWFVVACWQVRRSWHDTGTHAASNSRWQWWQRLQPLLQKHLPSFRSEASLRRLKEEHPIQWLGLRSRGHAQLLWLAVLLVCLGALLFGWQRGSSRALEELAWLAFILFWGLKIWIAVVACNLTFELRQEGLLDLLVITPQKTSAIADGLGKALVRGLAGPLTALTVFVLGWQLVDGIVHENAGRIAFSWFVALFFLSLALLDVYALGSTGLWFGLTATKPHTAVLRTLITVLGIPWLVLLIPCVGVVLLVLSPLWSAFLLRWGKFKLENELLHVLSEPSHKAAKESVWRPAWDMLPPMEMHREVDSPKKKAEAITPPPLVK